jgi:hypothetical protein
MFRIDCLRGMKFTFCYQHSVHLVKNDDRSLSFVIVHYRSLSITKITNLRYIDLNIFIHRLKKFSSIRFYTFAWKYYYTSYFHSMFQKRKNESKNQQIRACQYTMAHHSYLNNFSLLFEYKNEYSIFYHFSP